jgi:Helix-turn-helix domain
VVRDVAWATADDRSGSSIARLFVWGGTTLYALIKRGDLKPFKLGRKTLFCASDLAAFLDRLREGRP